MAGHMGDERVTVKNLKIAGVDKENNLLMIKGAVPGARGGLLEIQKIEK
jgi:large subunit ribosomal protein L3